MEEIERRAESILAELPDYIWDGDRPPIPVEEIADSHFGLHVRDVAPAEMRDAPGCPQLGADETLSGLLLPASARSGSTPTRPSSGRRGGGSRSPTSSATTSSTGPASSRCSAARPRSPRPRRRRRRAPPIPVTEEEANAFAAALLMPAPLVEHYYRRTGGDFEQLCVVFESRGAAMGRRLHAVI